MVSSTVKSKINMIDFKNMFLRRIAKEFTNHQPGWQATGASWVESRRERDNA